MANYPNLGFGLGLRSEHIDQILETGSKAQWFEALSENFMGINQHGEGRMLEALLEIRKNFPVVLHCVSLNIGNTEGIDTIFTNKLKGLIDFIEPEWVSDHLCWTGIHGQSAHELLPLPYTREAVEIVSRNIIEIQNIIKKPFLIENTSSYMSFKQSEMEEWEFISEIVKRTDCGLLLDVNNIFVSSENHDFKAKDFIDGIPTESIGQIHLAGHRVEENGLLIDTHDNFVRDEVWDLLKYTLQKKNDISIMVEWDSNVPELSTYEEEMLKAKKISEGLK